MVHVPYLFTWCTVTLISNSIVSFEAQFETWWWPSARAETCCLSNKYSITLLAVFWLYYPVPSYFVTDLYQTRIVTAVPTFGNILFLLYSNHTDICPFLNLSLECTLTILKVRNNTTKWRICGCVNITLKRDTFLWEIREWWILSVLWTVFGNMFVQVCRIDAYVVVISAARTSFCHLAVPHSH